MVLFSSITRFVEQVGRVRKNAKKDTLDTMSRIYVGPTSQSDTFIFPIGTPDWQYSLMTAISSTAKDLGHGMGITEVTVNFQGKLASGSRYTSVPTISTSWSEGEVSYTNSSQTTDASGNATLALIHLSHRYIGRNVTIAYITNFRPTGEATNLGSAKDYMGFSNEWDTITGISYGSIGQVNGYFSDIRCTDIKIDDLADGWYKVTETYQSRMFPKSAAEVKAAGAFKIFYESKLAGKWPTEQEYMDQYNQQQKGQADQAAQQAYQTDLQNYQESVAATQEYENAQLTGLDSAWSADAQKQASSVTPGGGSASDTGMVSTDATAQPDWAGPDSSGIGDWASSTA